METPSDKTTADHGQSARPASNGSSETAAGKAAARGADRPIYEMKTPSPNPPNRQLADIRAARRNSPQPRRPDRLIAWLAALACLAVAAVPLSVALLQPDTLPLEAEVLSRSTETWHQQEAFPSLPGDLEPWVPLQDGQRQISEPPGGTWLHLLAFVGLESDAGEHDLRAHARSASLVLALVTIAAVFWATMSIGGLIPAILAGVVVGSLPVLLFYGRMASDLFAGVALVTLAVAAALWALRPMRPANHLVRQGVGWTLCGILLGMATLTAGLPAAMAVVIPLALILILCPNRLNHVLGLVAAVLIGGLLTTPWALHVHEQDPDVWQAWIATIAPQDLEQWPAMAQLAGHRLGLLLLASLPWTVWLIAGLLQPFSTSSAGARTRLFIGWVWFVSVLILVLLMPGQGDVAEVIVVLPPAALLVAQVIRQYRELAAEGRDARIWTWLCWPHAMVLLVLSVVGPAVMHFQPWLIDEGWLTQPIAMPMHPFYWAGMAVCLILLVGLSLRFIIRRYPGKATVCWALWTMLAFSAAIYPTAYGPLMQDEPMIIRKHDGNPAATIGLKRTRPHLSPGMQPTEPARAFSRAIH